MYVLYEAQQLGPPEKWDRGLDSEMVGPEGHGSNRPTVARRRRERWADSW